MMMMVMQELLLVVALLLLLSWVFLTWMLELANHDCLIPQLPICCPRFRQQCSDPVVPAKPNNLPAAGFQGGRS